MFARLSEQDFHHHKLYIPSNLQSSIAANFFEPPKNWSYARYASRYRECFVFLFKRALSRYFELLLTVDKITIKLKETLK